MTAPSILVKPTSEGMFSYQINNAKDLDGDYLRTEEISGTAEEILNNIRMHKAPATLEKSRVSLSLWDILVWIFTGFGLFSRCYKSNTSDQSPPTSSPAPAPAKTSFSTPTNVPKAATQDSSTVETYEEIAQFTPISPEAAAAATRAMAQKKINEQARAFVDERQRSITEQLRQEAAERQKNTRLAELAAKDGATAHFISPTQPISVEVPQAASFNQLTGLNRMSFSSPPKPWAELGDDEYGLSEEELSQTEEISQTIAALDKQYEIR